MMVVFNATGSQRKALADALGEIIGAEKKYQGVPSCAYQVGEYTIDRDGNIEAGCIKEDIIEQEDELFEDEELEEVNEEDFDDEDDDEIFNDEDDEDFSDDEEDEDFKGEEVEDFSEEE